MALPALDGLSTALVIVSAVACHTWFCRFEPHSWPTIIFLLFGVPTALVALLHFYFSTALSVLLISYPLYIGTLLTSLVGYRLSPLHPLASFPGPIICKITRFWAWYKIRSGNQHRYYKNLHDRYGTHVRTGPNHLHICDADAIPTVLGAKGFPRGGRYEVTKLPGTNGSLLSLIHLQDHAPRRRLWDRSLNTSAVQGYQDILARRVTQLVSCLERRQGIVDLSLWLSCFSFDFLGDLAFGGAFKLMEQGGDTNGHMRMVRRGVKHQELAGAIPWVKSYHSWLPSGKNLHYLFTFAKKSVLARKAQGSAKKDLFYHLLDEEGVGTEPLNLPTLILESTLAIVAGSDTTGTALSNLFYYVLSTPGVYRRLQHEVDETFPSGSDVCGPNAPNMLGGMKFLNAVINETLRLQPAIPSGVQRILPRGRGKEIVAGRVVPEATTIQIPTYSVHRDSRYFSPDPDKFLPERWLTEAPADFKLNQAAYFPFSYGPMNCVGKNLALQELRAVTCSLLQRFELEFAPGWDSGEWEKKLSDSFVLEKGELPVLIRVRG